MITCETGVHTLSVKLYNDMPCPHCEGSVRECMECGKETTGSIGAAGIPWKMLCQSCKDNADNALKVNLGFDAK